MSEQQLLRVGVECHAGHRGEQTLRTLFLADRRIDVAEVVDSWRVPGYRYLRTVTCISFATMSEPTFGS